MPQYTEAIQEIIAKPPVWIVRWGISLFSGVFVLLLLLAWLIRYPTVLQAPMVLSSRNPPIQLYTKSNGHLHFLVNDRDSVQKSQVLAWVESNTDYEEVERLESILQTQSDPTQIFKQKESILPTFKKLGELQSFYLLWKNAVENRKAYIEIQLNPQKIKAIQDEITYYEALQKKLQQEQILLEQGLVLSFQKYRTDSLLLKQGVLAPLDLHTSEQALIQQKRNITQLQSNALNQSLQIAGKEAGVSQIYREEKQTLFQLQQEISKTGLSLQNQIQIWKERHLILSPLAGRVSWLRFFTDNEYVFTDKPLLSVVPFESMTAIGYVSLPVSGAGKVQIGQKVWVNLSNYPMAEFGVIEGEIIHIALLPQEDKQSQNYYNLSIAFPKGLKTTLGKEIPYQAQMLGQASIITEDLSLLARIFYGLRGLWGK